MKTISNYRIAVAAMALVIVVGSIAVAGSDQAAWFDMENCSMCKNISGHAGLMENVTWEQHNIKNGIISMATVPEEYLATYRKAQQEMDGTAKRLMKGEALPLCGSCSAFGNILMKGVEMETVNTQHGDVMILTSADAGIVEELQDWAAKNAAEMASHNEHGHAH